MTAARLTDRLIGVVGTLVLARLLTPADFGLVAMAMSVIGLIELASAFGFEISIVRATNPTRAQYDTVWTLNLLFGVGCATVTALAALPAARYYGDDRLIAVMLVLALSWAIGSLANVGVVDFQRTLDFAREFKLMTARRVVGFLTTIVLAFLTRSYWALVAGTVATRVVGLALSYLWHPYRPRLSLAKTGDIFSFSIWIFVDKLASFGNVRAADFVLGRTHGPTELGVYRLGDEVGHLPGSEFVAPLNRALLPGFSHLLDGGRSLRDIVVMSSGVVAMVLFPACLGINAVAESAVRVMLGPQWLTAIPIVQVLSLESLFFSLWANQHTALFAAGMPKLPGSISMGRFIVFAPCVIAFTPRYGAMGVAASSLACSALALVAGLLLCRRAFGARLTDYLGAIWRPAAAAALMWLAVNWVQSAIGTTDSVLMELRRLLVGVAMGVAAYAAALGLLYIVCGRPHGAERLLIGRMALLLRR